MGMRLRRGAGRLFANPLRHQLGEYAMHTLIYYLTVLLLGGVFVWCLRSGYGGWEWWDRRQLYRDQYPFAYWVEMTIYFVVFIYFIVNGKHMRLK